MESQSGTRTIELDCRNRDARDRYATYLFVMGRFDEAIAEARLTVALDQPGVPMPLEPMCYYVYMKSRKRLGVRAMRQNLSVYLRRVGSGETFEVTARGRPVAVLGPVEGGLTPIERLVASGRASLPEGDLLDLGPPPKVGRARRLSQALQEQRAERS